MTAPLRARSLETGPGLAFGFVSFFEAGAVGGHRRPLIVANKLLLKKPGAGSPPGQCFDVPSTAATAAASKR